MSASEEEIAKKIKVMKDLASRRIDDILKARNVKQNDGEISLINSIIRWFKK
ncbi:hypothetical protein [Methylomicrobium lacus]|uniref:hypothetical protein n=1 Tax=Methylomicrobium lacus TaxID=136992 RepID=UPI0035A8FAAD